MTLLCDNKATIEIAKNPNYHDRTKHVGLIDTSLKKRSKGVDSN